MKQVSHFPVLVVLPAECCVQLSTIFLKFNMSGSQSHISKHRELKFFKMALA